MRLPRLFVIFIVVFLCWSSTPCTGLSLLQQGTVVETPPASLRSDPQQPSQYHAVKRNHLGLVSLHENPDVLQIDSFLTPRECQQLITKARPHLRPCLVMNTNTGSVEPDPNRSSTNVNVPQAEIPSVVSKICHLAQCRPQQLEVFQILRYEPGQKFTPHTDGFEGPVTAFGFEESGRLVTMFCYLNDCTAGGETAFPKLDEVQVTPQQGRLVVHFPCSVDLREDPQTEHESRPVISGEKWLLVTWVWKHARSDPRYDDARLPALSESVI
jgi:prolyl 4-hydroxylase